MTDVPSLAIGLVMGAAFFGAALVVAVGIAQRQGRRR
jgi:hypothetical protein